MHIVDWMDAQIGSGWWFARLLCWLRFGPDSDCDCCGKRTYWNGNIHRPVPDRPEIETTLCDYCWVRQRELEEV